MNIYIVLTMTGTKFSKLLQFATQKEFTHVSIALDKDLKELYSFGRRSMVIPLIAGFVREELDQGVYKKYDTSCEVLELNVSKRQYRKIKSEINKYVSAYEKYRYNLLGLPFMWFDIPYERENHLVCSQFVASILTFSNTYEFKKSWAIVRPIDFYNIPKIRSIYKGQLRNYNKKTC